MGYHYQSIQLTDGERKLIYRIAYLLDVIYNSKKELNEIKEGLSKILARSGSDWLYLENVLEFCRYENGKLGIRRHR